MITALFSLLLIAEVTPAAEPAATATAAPAQKVERKEEKKICKREESTESRLGGKRICLTADEWKARRRAEG